MTVRNLFDAELADRGLLAAVEARSVTIEDVLVDTGALHLCLPANTIAALGLRFHQPVNVTTASGLRPGRMFRGAEVEVEGRSGFFDCVETPDGVPVLLGALVMESLGLEPDLRNQRLRLLPLDGPDTHILAL